MIEFLTILIILTFIIMFAVILIWSVLSFLDLADSNYDKEMMEYWNYFKWIIYGGVAIWGLVKLIYNKFHKSGIDKEIENEEKEIAELERHKEKMEKLKKLKRRKEKLFEEVQESEVEREEVLVICDSCGNYMDYLGIDSSRREVYECKDCNLTLKAPLCTN